MGTFCTFFKNLSKHFGTKNRLFVPSSVVQNVFSINSSVLANFLECLPNLCSKFLIFPRKRYGAQNTHAPFFLKKTFNLNNVFKFNL